MNQLHLHTSPDPDALAAAFAAHVDRAGDPFARPLVLVPGAGVQRWLSQQAARRSASDGEGITAGWDVHGLASLERLLTAADGDDPWSPRRLVWAILAVVDAGDPGVAPLARHLDANEQRYANALRVARLLARYADHRPDLLAGWLADPDAAAAAAGPDAWQVRLWVALHAVIDASDPVESRPRLAAAIASGERPLPWPQAHVFAPRQVSPAQRDLLSALARRVPVHVWLPTVGPHDSANALALALGRRARAWHEEWLTVATSATEHTPGPSTEPTLLGALQASVHAGAAVPARAADGSVSIHSSHGEARQVEVLRETLTGLFADDPSLEPRDVVIACPDPGVLAPHLAAAFTAPADGVGARAAHPATRFRVQVAAADSSTSNQIVTLLGDLMGLHARRATASDLLALASHPFVARRFSFDTDDLARLEDLIAAAGIRWGIGREHREAFGLGRVTQNTWQVGVQRLVMGEAFSADELVHAGVVSTVDDVSSTDATLIGALAEFVSRTSRAVDTLGRAGTAPEWAARWRTVVAQMADVPFEEGWQLSQFWAVLAAIEDAAADTDASLRPTDALALLAAHLAERGVRPAYGNGSAVVCSLDALARVPHRVVCLVGLDDRTFPRRGAGDGDDLLARDPRPGDPDPGADDRQALLDAVLAARDHLVVIHQGQSSLTPEPHHPPAGLQDLMEAVPAAVVTEPLQPFAPSLFAGQPHSFDPSALAAARAVVGPRQAPPDRYAVTHLHRAAPLDSLDVERLAAFLQHPGKFLLRERADLTLGEDTPLAESLPLELDQLDRWKIGEAMLASLQSGHDLASVERDQWLSGALPPHRLGSAILVPLGQTAGDVHDAFVRAVGEATPNATAIDLDLEGVRLTGRLVTRAGVLAEAHVGSVHAKHLAAAWVRLLALTVQQGRRTDAVLVGKKGTRRLAAPPPELAARLLTDLLALAQHGTERVLPLPPRVAEFWAEQRHRGLDPRDSDRLAKVWGWDSDDVWRLWFSGSRTPWAARREPGDPWGSPGEDTVLGALAVRVWEPIRRAAQ